MNTIADNLRVWDREYAWPEGGDEWSRDWGNAECQWFGFLLPRLHKFLPTGAALEIAPGFGRWTQFLQPQCERLLLVDLAPKCIEHCRSRFANCSNLEYFVNDGSSLDMIQDESLDFVFSYDSLVHADNSVLASYVRQIGHKLKPGGWAFIHHSNARKYFLLLRILSLAGKLS
jgi:SAM-dependent methyltransferase